jgi:hypothetical protein
MLSRRTTAILLAGAALGALLLALYALFGGSLQWRLGPIRVRVSDGLRPLIAGAVLGTAAMWAGWPWRDIRRLLPVVIAAWMLLGLGGYARRGSPDYVPISDIAVIESYTIHATNQRLFVGPYSRFHWHHPGPMVFYLLAPFYVVSGERTAGLAAGAVGINLCALLVILIVAGRSGGPWLTAAAGSLVVLFMWRARDMVASPWNPHVLIMPTMALVLLTAEMVAARRLRLPAVALVATFIVQTHVGLVPTVAAVVATGACIAVASALRTADAATRARAISAVNAAAWLLVAAWMLPLVEELYRTPGNLSELWRFFTGVERAGQPFGVAFRAWADMLSSVFSPRFSVAWGGRTFTDTTLSWTHVFAFLQVAGLAVVAVRAGTRDRRLPAALAGLLLLAAAIALWSVTRIEDGLYDHAVFWICGLGVLNVAVLLAEALDRVRPPATAVVGALVLAAGVILGGQQLTRAVALTYQSDLEHLSARRLSDGVKQHLNACKPLVRIDQPTWPLAASVLLELQRDGLPFAVEEGWLPMFSDEVAARGDETCELTFVWPEQRPRLAADPRQTLIAERDRMSVFLSRMPPHAARQ